MECNCQRIELPDEKKFGGCFTLGTKRRHGKESYSVNEKCCLHILQLKKTMYACRGCDQAFCMLPPTHLSIPGSDPPKSFAGNGLFSWQLVHGLNTWLEFDKAVDDEH